MVQQIIKFSDSTETIINYKKEQGMEETNVEAPAVEESAPEVVEEVVAEAPAESVEEAAQ